MPIRINLDLDTLRTFSIVHDHGSLAQAAERLGRTPSAISLQMKRLQDDLETTLFRKRGRGLVLTEAGVLALAYARRILTLNDELLDAMQGENVAGHIRVGCTQDFAGILPSVLSHFSSLYPRMQIELRIEGNGALADAIQASEIDLAVVIGQADRARAETVGQLDIVWIASSTFAPPQDQPLPLAALGPQCVFRKRAIQLLEEAKIAHRIAVGSPSVEGLWAALLGGIGVTARTGLNLPEGLASGVTLYGLPHPGQLPVTTQRAAKASGAAMDRMAALLAESVRMALLSAHRAKDSKAGRNRVTNISAGRRRKA